MNNFNLACSILDIQIEDNDDIKEEVLKKHYRTKALLYHPDKNSSPEANSKFHEINESYEYLMKYQGYMEPDEYECSENTYEQTEPKRGTYRWILYSFLKNLLKAETNQNLFYTIIKRVITNCETNGLEILQKLDKGVLIKIYDILKKHKELFHFTEIFIDKIETIIAEKVKNDECIILNPTLDDLIDNNLYKLTVNGFTYIVPLWHHELIYDNSGNDIYIKIHTILPDNIEIDSLNNIHIKIEYKIPDLWVKDKIEVIAGKNKYIIIPSLLKLKTEQTLIFTGQGISKINTENVFDVSKKSDVLIHMKMSL